VGISFHLFWNTFSAHYREKTKTEGSVLSKSMPVDHLHVPLIPFWSKKLLANDIAGDRFSAQEVLFKSIFFRVLSSTVTEGQKCGALTPEYDSLGIDIYPDRKDL
jgi:hypothetical protein